MSMYLEPKSNTRRTAKKCSTLPWTLELSNQLSFSTGRIQGLDTPTPFLQLSGTIFKGQHDSLLGTELLFMEEKGRTWCVMSFILAEDASGRALRHVGSTEQRIRFKEVQMQRKIAVDDAQSGPETQDKGRGKEKALKSTLPSFLSGSDNVALLDRIAGSDVRLADETVDVGDPEDGSKRARRKGKKKQSQPVGRRRSTRKKPGEYKLAAGDDDAEMDIS